MLKANLNFNPSASADKLLTLSLQPLKCERTCILQRRFGSSRFLYVEVPQVHTFNGIHLKGQQDLLKSRFKDLYEILNWAILLGKNGQQGFRKAYARLDLFLSQTIPTVRFTYREVKYVKDALADGTLESEEFNDRRVWMISAPYDTTDAKHLKRWIHMSESQRKVIPRDEDFSDSCEADRWSFELVKYTAPPKSSTLNLDFIPILQNRHVSRITLRQVIESQLEMDFAAFFESLDDPLWLSSVRSKLKIRLGKSAMALGVADPTGCLKPGGIHMAFSETFRDEVSGEVWSHLKSEVSVARHPSLRCSDLQKVRAVYKEELSHLTDVVVFPSTGCVPLAHKLQGGDYDGDTFWLCWDPRLTADFENAPSPVEEPKLEYYGIKKDSRKLRDILGSDNNVDTWLSESFAFKL
ncbi:hypothetical protein M436DRAFT_68213 [Aureobasidium namibiae CBS 147.97]|uniref:RNA-dependent RNA polymerase n=1 Tax=Aureobasidium namibiae CBS 147.97 TaxID=1043004 RepID=A0A074W641_9PEZI|nr:uncharacterized protein M436DRAFT_68213 [Aureobasidium namibiae CBS 147.97]KEQ68348.1 hypothetical protein M436DRAFT_68213 [Aureobasidium namibiae CBS 147.97]